MIKTKKVLRTEKSKKANPNSRNFSDNRLGVLLDKTHSDQGARNLTTIFTS